MFENTMYKTFLNWSKFLTRNLIWYHFNIFSKNSHSFVRIPINSLSLWEVVNQMKIFQNLQKMMKKMMKSDLEDDFEVEVQLQNLFGAVIRILKYHWGSQVKTRRTWCIIKLIFDRFILFFNYFNALQLSSNQKWYKFVL